MPIKRYVLVDPRVSYQNAEELLVGERHADELLDDEIVKKLASGCDDLCKAEKEKSLVVLNNAINASNQYYETEIKAVEKKVNYYNKSSYALKQLANSLDKLSDEMKSPERVRTHLTSLVNNADHLDKNTKDKMLESIKNTDSFESVKTITDTTRKELADKKKDSIREKDDIKKTWGHTKEFFGSVGKGLKSMSKTERLTKTITCLSGIASAIGKFQAKNEDGSPNALKIVGGVLDITNSIATFLPPPASIITGTISGIFSIFGGGAPSTVDVIKDEFRKMKKFTVEQFAKQRKFISDQFSKQNIFISGQFSKQTMFIENEFLKQTAFIDERFRQMERQNDQSTQNILNELNKKASEIGDKVKDLNEITHNQTKIIVHEVQTLIHGINQRSDERQTLTLLQFQQTQRNSYEQTKALLTQLNTIQDTVLNETDLVLKEMSAQNELMLIQFDKNQELLVEQKQKIDEGFQQLNHSIKAGIIELKDFMNERDMLDLADDAAAMLVAINEKFHYIEVFDQGDMTGELAGEIKADVGVLQDTTAIEKIRKAFERMCIDKQFLKCDQNMLEKNICTKIAYSYFSIEKYRDIVITDMINLLQPVTDLSKIAEAYLAVQSDRRSSMKNWISAKLVDNNEIACPLFKTRAYYWEKSEYLQYVLDYFTYIDPNLTKNINDLRIEDCKLLEESVTEQCCACNDKGSKSNTICNYVGQCNCAMGYNGLKCDQCEDGFYMDDNLGICQNCNCNVPGSHGTSCDSDGKCNCKSNFKGSKCSECSTDDRYGNKCELCKCNDRGELNGTCDQNGQCHCKNGFQGKKCADCDDEFYGLNCKACECNMLGSSSQKCDKYNGKCTCTTGFKGHKCKECKNGYFGLSCTICDCDKIGSDQISCG